VLLFQTVTEKSEKTFQTIAVIRVRVLESELLELGVHARGEMVAEEVRPKTEKGVHFLRLTYAELLALFQAARVELLVLLLHEAVLLQ